MSTNPQQAKKKKVRDPPQTAIDSFWTRFLSQKPSRAACIFPEALYSTLLPSHSSPDGATTSRNAAASYEAAAQECRDRVARIVKECRRTNEKFTDAEFDIESDFSLGNNNCLTGLKAKDNETESCPPGRPEGPTGMLSKSSTSSKPKSVHRVPWVFKEPRFSVGGFKGTGVRQGKNGDCWFMAAISTLCSVEGMMERVCVARDEKCGVYGFVFYRDGEWISTVVDDYLYLKYKNWTGNYDPRGDDARRYRERYQRGSENLFFAKCDNNNETWLPLIEKAYAKVHGDYEAIEGGWMGEGVEDLTGGVNTPIRTQDILDPDELWKDLTSLNKDFLFSVCSRSSGEDPEPWKHGLALCHAYSVLKAVEAKGEDGETVRLVKIRNPWGKKDYSGGGEWDGPWSDGSETWTPYWMEKLDHRFGNDGVFWMTYESMLSEFEEVDRTRLFNSEWQVIQKWTPVNVAYVSGYLRKKFTIEVKNQGQFVIVLSQLDDRYFRGLEGQYWFKLHFVLRKKGSSGNDFIVRARGTWRSRGVNTEVELEPGTYEVLPMIVANRVDDWELVEDVIKEFAGSRPQKLRQIGLNHDIAFAKGVINEEPPKPEIKSEMPSSSNPVCTCSKQKESAEPQVTGAEQPGNTKDSEAKQKDDKAQQVIPKPDDQEQGGQKAEEVKPEPQTEDKAGDKSEDKDSSAATPDKEQQSENLTEKQNVESAETEDQKAETPSQKQESEVKETDCADDKQIDPSSESIADSKNADSDTTSSDKTGNDDKNEDKKLIDTASDDEDLKSDGKSEEWEKISESAKEEAEPSQKCEKCRADSLKPNSTPKKTAQSYPTRPQHVRSSPKSSGSTTKTDENNDDDVIESPWNASCVIGLRVYTKDRETTVTTTTVTDDDHESLQVVEAPVGATV